jgi:hypothetical protein
MGFGALQFLKNHEKDPGLLFTLDPFKYTGGDFLRQNDRIYGKTSQ